jgi:hypothetical protein
LILGGLIGVILASGEGIGPTIPFLIVAAFVARRFQTRRSRMLRRFGKKAGKEEAVTLVTASGNRITVAVESPPARTYLRINSLFASLNEALYSGAPFEIEILDSVPEEQKRELVTRPGLLYLDAH